MTVAATENEFEDSPSGWAKRWTMEFAAAKKELETWHKESERVITRYSDKRENKFRGESRWNLFTSNVQTQQAMLFGRTPTVNVDRRFADQNDDVARVAGEVLERMLNGDLDKYGSGFSESLRSALMDFLLVDSGTVRLRLDVQTSMSDGEPARLGPDGAEIAPAIEPQERTDSEEVETLYVHWRDLLWSPCRVWADMRWRAYRAPMGREALIERFGEIGRSVPLGQKRSAKDEDAQRQDPWARADVWEIWSKEHGRTFWFVEGMSRILDDQSDPLGLVGFFPEPRPMMANATTSAYVPNPEWCLARDLYEEVDQISTRIRLLVKSCKVAGVYDRANEGVKRLFAEAIENQLIPVDNWAMFGEKGGLRGCIDWIPLDQIVGALAQLRQHRVELVDALYQLTGMSDIMRGQGAAEGGVTATEQSIKARFGSVRMQRKQDEIARFASDVQCLRAEIISRHFDPATIVERSNAQYMPAADQALLPQAIELIKTKYALYRVHVQPESISLTDFAALKQERLELLDALTRFMQTAAPLAQAMPGSMPFLLQMLQCTVAGLRGSSAMEGILDQAINAAQQQAQQPQAPAPPDPKVQALQLKGQLDLQKTQADLQADLVRTQAEVQAENAKQQAQTQWNLREAKAKEMMKISRPPVPQGGVVR